LYGIDNELLQKLQVIQNATVRVVSAARKFDHLSPVLRAISIGFLSANVSGFS